MNPKELGKFSTHNTHYYRIVEGKHIFLKRTTNKCTEEDVPLWRSSAVFYARKRPGNNRPMLNVWHDKTKPIQGMRNVLATICQIHRCRRTVVDTGETVRKLG